MEKYGKNQTSISNENALEKFYRHIVVKYARLPSAQLKEKQLFEG
jgi:hypothetical protein